MCGSITKVMKIDMRKTGRVLWDFVSGAVGLFVMNAVLSFAVNPYLGNTLGAANQGRILYYSSLTALMGATFGSGANYGRMKVHSSGEKTENGEYNIFLLITTAILFFVTLGAVLLKGGDKADATLPGLFLLVSVTSVRYYADVEYRLSLNYRRFSLFYIVIGAGYLLGLFLYRFTHSWVMIFLTGEIAGLLFVGFTGKIFKKPVMRVTPRFPAHLRILFVLSFSFLLSDFVAGADRLLLPLLLENGDEMTALFYYASIIGKLMSLLSTPLNGVLAGHLYGKQGGITRKRFLQAVLLLAAVFVVVTGFSVLGSHLYIYWFYRPYYETVKPLFLLANAGQVIFFICNTMMVIVLRYTDEKVQMLTAAVYVAVFLGCTIPLILNFGIWGMAWGIFIVNTVKFLLYAVLGLIRIGRKGREEETS